MRTARLRSSSGYFREQPCSAPFQAHCSLPFPGGFTFLTGGGGLPARRLGAAHRPHAPPRGRTGRASATPTSSSAPSVRPPAGQGHRPPTRPTVGPVAGVGSARPSRGRLARLHLHTRRHPPAPDDLPPPGDHPPTTQARTHLERGPRRGCHTRRITCPSGTAPSATLHRQRDATPTRHHSCIIPVLSRAQLPFFAYAHFMGKQVVAEPHQPPHVATLGGRNLGS